MEFKATLTLDASPALIGVVSNLVNALTGLKSSAPVNESVVAHMAVPGKEFISRDPDAESKSIAVEQPQPISESKYTKEQVKAAAAAKRDKRDEMKKILDEMGVKSIPALPEDRYEEFMQKISVL